MTQTLPVFIFTLIFTATILSSCQSAEYFETDATRMMSNPHIQNAILETAKISPLIRARNCKNSHFTPSNNFVLLSPEHSVLLMVKQTVKWEGCGQERNLNILMTANLRKMAVRTANLAPGDTRASPILQKDAGMSAMPMVIGSTGIKNCKTFYMDNTKFLRKTGRLSKAIKVSSWDELWTFSICEKKVAVIMHFIPDGTGTTVSAELQKP